MVYPGANHTRFHHALGCLHLMQNAVRILRFKGVSISDSEEDGLYIAILLHDIGHMLTFRPLFTQKEMTATEQQKFDQHSIVGVAMLKNIDTIPIGN